MLMEDGDQIRIVSGYNYEKFFAAIATANQDKWDDQNPSNTSARPLGNKRNQTDHAAAVQTVSDQVRQFAIDWYLDAEAAQLMERLPKSEEEFQSRTPGLAYGDELYDEALDMAIQKAENYLIPFFSYDLDEIYAVRWDMEEHGGEDGDSSTLSADLESELCFCGFSQYLPYGTYVVVEQQPQYAKFKDFKNKHYQVDTPKEIIVPSVYAENAEEVEFLTGLSGDYLYDPHMTPEEMTEKYFIRFHEEDKVIKAHNHNGDFEIYPFGLDITLAKTESGQKQCSISEHGGIADQVPFPGGTVTEENPSGIVYKDQVSTMTGVQTAYAGLYAPMLVPWASRPNTAGKENYEAAHLGFRDTWYQARLRIEKLDSETHENLIHDGAVFRIYEAEHDVSEDGDGKVLFYEEDTLISGSEEFLESMGARQIVSAVRGRLLGAEYRFTGIVSAGTPICREEKQIIQTDIYGNKTGDFQAFSTTWEGRMRQGQGEDDVWAEQNVGYLETPEPLGAGVYVLAEIKAPVGYARTKPIAIELYSDKIAYYKEGKRDTPVMAAMYEYVSDPRTVNGNKTQDQSRTARVFVENTPIRLSVEKLKEAAKGYAGTTKDQTVTWRFSGRLEGSLVQIGGRSDYEYAYLRGEYLGYAWKKGTLEYLHALKEAGEQVSIVYHDGVFAGYGYITRKLQTADDENRYVAGAVMTLYEALELNPSGDFEDYSYEGLTVQRSLSGAVTRMYVRKGYAGSHVELRQVKREETDSNGENDGKNAVWEAQNIERSDTDILYYDLGNLDIFYTETTDGTTVRYGYLKTHEGFPLYQMEEDKANEKLTDQYFSIYAFQNGIPYLELTGGDFLQISYSASDKRLTGGFSRPVIDGQGNVSFSQGVRIYHLDAEGNRDSMVDPDTGMAYVVEQTQGIGKTKTSRVLVWPVHIVRDSHGIVIAREKITTSRIATLEEEESSYITGSWKSDNRKPSHHAVTIRKTQGEQNLNGEPLLIENFGSMEKNMNPVLDRHGLPRYYQKSDETYQQTTKLYDRNGDLVREKEQDLLEAFHQAAYMVQEQIQSEQDIYHRQGESYVLENTWVTGDKTPDDPFQEEGTDGQPDILKRIPEGTYILEEVKVPEGYAKGFPAGVIIQDSAELQKAQMTDYTTKIMLGKADGTDNYTYQILDMLCPEESGKPEVIGTIVEGKGVYGQKQLSGAKLSLYPAQRIYTSDLITYPEGTYLKKVGNTPLSYQDTGSQKGSQHMQTASWTTSETPLYIEGIPAGEYLLEEEETPEGFVTIDPVPVSIAPDRQVQTFLIYDDHTKLEIEKFTVENGERSALSGAGFTLYPAVAEDPLQYDQDNPVDTWVSGDVGEYAGFVSGFEEMYQEYGTDGKTVSWIYQGKSHTAVQESCMQSDASLAGGMASQFPATAQLMFCIDNGKAVRVTVYERRDEKEKRNFTFEYQLDYRKLEHINEHAVSYMTLEGIWRIDYLPVNGCYVLVETAPPGYAKAADMVIRIQNTADIQRYSLLNQPWKLLISKSAEGTQGELKGAKLALYRAGQNGALVQDDKHLAAWWISGSDGVYTETEKINKQIPEGYKEGDLRPHTLKTLPDGIYYLVELESPDYYERMEPMTIEVTSSVEQKEISVIHIENKPVSGKLVIRKRGERGDFLPGAVFELSAYCKSDLKTPVFTKIISGHKGEMEISDLPVGEPDETGEIKPYQYILKETMAPEGYQINPKVHWFEFSAEEEAKISLEIINEKTRIYLQKKEFDGICGKSQSMFIEGAALAVYHLEGTDELGKWIYDKKAPFCTWITSKEQPVKVLEGVTAGQSYLLVEEEAPVGYQVMEPIMFTISEDGRKIIYISSQSESILVENLEQDMLSHPLEPSKDFIHALTFRGRYVSRVEKKVSDQQGAIAASWTATGEGHPLTEKDGILEGELYIIEEITIYSDGTRKLTERVTKPCHMKEGVWYIPDRTVSQVFLTVDSDSGARILSFVPAEQKPELTAGNPAAGENPEILIYNRGRQSGEGLVSGQEIFNQIVIENPLEISADMELYVSLGEGVRVLDPGTGIQIEQGLTFTVQHAEPLERIKLSFVTKTEESAREYQVEVRLQVGEKKIEARKRVPVLLKDRLTVFYELTGSGKELEQDMEKQFKIYLYDQKGEELKGAYAYDGSRAGRIKSGDTVSLAGNQFISIDPGRFYKNIRYKVESIGEENAPLTSLNSQGQIESGTEMCAVFRRNVTDSSKRNLWRRGQTYTMTETTCYQGNAEIVSGCIQFTLNDQAAIDAIGVFDRKLSRHISKTAMEAGMEEAEIPGAKLQILTESGQVLEEWISDTSPHKITADLKPGVTYILHEEQAPKGYCCSEDMPFMITSDAAEERIMMLDKETWVSISKTDITGKAELQGALLQILDKTGNIVESWVSGETPHEMKGKLVAGEHYILHEETAPEGYAYALDVSFKAPENGMIEQVVMKDKATQVLVRKTDITGEKELPGACLEILDENGTIVEQWTSGTSPYEICGKLVAGKEYILREKSSPKGYACASDIRFTVSMDGSADMVVMKDDMTRVEVLKVSEETGQPLVGAVLQLISPEGDIKKEWISTQEACQLEGVLTAGGEYRIRELQAPAGYERLTEDMVFLVPHTPDTLRLVIKNRKRTREPDSHVRIYRFGIRKEDSDNGNALAGAHIRIWSENGSWQREGITDETGMFQVAVWQEGLYHYQEVKAPKGYMLDETIYDIQVEREETDKKIWKLPNKRQEGPIGRIMAWYGSFRNGQGAYSFAGVRNMRIPRLGDEADKIIKLAWKVFWSASAALLGICIFEKYMDRKKKGKGE